MNRALVLLGCLAPVAAFAQPNFAQAAGVGAVHHMMHRQYVARPRQTPQQPPSPVATRGGQDAFAAIQEIVEILAADPKTDWSKVNIDALRQHLSTDAASVARNGIDHQFQTPAAHDLLTSLLFAERLATGSNLGALV